MGTRPKEKVNTVQLQFPVGVPRPRQEDLDRFLKAEGITAQQVTAIYPDTRQRSFYIKFADELDYNSYLERKEYDGLFEFLDGRHVDIKVCKADENLTVVTVFEVPPEVDDEDIKAVLCQYGTVRKITWGRARGATEFPVYNGIRCIYMAVEAEIPNLLTFGGVERRVSYDGSVERCFKCGEAGHKRFQCPKNVVQQRIKRTGQDGQMISVTEEDFPPLPESSSKKTSPTLLSDNGAKEIRQECVDLTGEDINESADTIKTTSANQSDTDENLAASDDEAPLPEDEMEIDDDEHQNKNLEDANTTSTEDKKTPKRRKKKKSDSSTDDTPPKSQRTDGGGEAK